MSVRSQHLPQEVSQLPWCPLLPLCHHSSPWFCSSLQAGTQWDCKEPKSKELWTHAAGMAKSDRSLEHHLQQRVRQHRAGKGE